MYLEVTQFEAAPMPGNAVIAKSCQITRELHKTADIPLGCSAFTGGFAKVMMATPSCPTSIVAVGAIAVVY